MRGSRLGAATVLMAAVLFAGPAMADEPPEDAAIALFGGDTVTSVVSTPVTIDADAPFLPDGVVVPFSGWQIFVEGTDAAGNGGFAVFLAGGGTVWLVTEGSATGFAATTEVLPVVIERPDLRPRSGWADPYPT